MGEGGLLVVSERLVGVQVGKRVHDRDGLRFVGEGLIIELPRAADP